MNRKEHVIQNAEKLKESRADISNPETQRERILAIDKKLLKEIGLFAARIKAIPQDSKYPNREPRALLVGGAVRDAILELDPKDADVEVYGIVKERLGSFLEQLFPGRVKTTGALFEVFKVSCEDGYEFDVSLPRREKKVAAGHKGFETEPDPDMSVEEAAKRRDFTINAMSADPLTGEIIDTVGGIDDIKSKTLRVTDHKRFQEDPLRVYRAIQFAGRFELEAEPESVALMRQITENGMLEELPKERIYEEWKKLFLKGTRPSRGLELARELGIVERYYQELHALIDCPQEPDWHPEGDVWTHTLMAIDEATKLKTLPMYENLNEEEKLSAIVGTLVHDVGKPPTTENINGKIRSLGHEAAGAQIAKTLTEKMGFGKMIQRTVEEITKRHLAPSELFKNYEDGHLDEKSYKNAVRRLLLHIAPVNWKVFLLVAEADKRGRGGENKKEYKAGVLFARVAQELEKEGALSPLVGGKDIMRITEEEGISIAPGPIFGKLLRAIEDERDKRIFATREEALVRLRELINEMKN